MLHRILRLIPWTILVSVATLAVVVTTVPWMGDKMQPSTWAIALAWPPVIATPLLYYFQRQAERLIQANRELTKTHAELELAHDEVKRAAETDAMTATLNRMGFYDHASRNGDLCGAMFVVDLDHFKSINDTYGHHAGDEALRLAARTIVETVRLSDIVGRVGGEEFAVYLPGATVEEALTVAERVRRNIEAIPFAPLGTPHQLTASVGVHVECPAGTVSDMMRLADVNLYRAKNAGRNRVAYGAGGECAI